MAVFKTPQLPDDLDPGTLTDGMVPVYDSTTQRWVPGSGTSGSGVKIGGEAPDDGWHLAIGSPPPPTPVTATGPTWTDNGTTGGGTWTTPSQTGVTYSPASGTATPGQSVTVTATAQTGYVLSGTTSWSHTFPTAPTPGAITDNFNAADSVLNGRTTTTGSKTWVSPAAGHEASTGGTLSMFIRSNKMANQGSGTGASAYLDAGTPNVRVEGDYDVTAGILNVTLAAVASPNPSNFNALGMRFGGGNAFLIEGSGAALAVLGPVTNTFPLTGTFALEYDGTNITGWLNGVQIHTASRPGRTGTRVGFGMPGTVTGQVTVDNLTVTPL